VGRTMEVEGSSKRHAWPPTDQFEKLLEEACSNHTYPIKHKLRDSGLMKSFMTSGSLSRGMEVDEVPNEDNTVPFLGEDMVMMIYDEHPSPERCRGPNPSLGTPAHHGRGCGNMKM
jgi:hypothetical protein